MYWHPFGGLMVLCFSMIAILMYYLLSSFQVYPNIPKTKKLANWRITVSDTVKQNGRY
jgi:hypothetical protein